jgi:biotin transport system substrate-specific component
MEEQIVVRRRTLGKTVLAALFAALIAAGTFVSIPLPISPVPVVLQNLFALLAGMVGGPALGAAAVGLYLFAGALGAPIFAGASGGFARFFSPSGGYLIGYLCCAILAGIIVGRPRLERPCPLWRLILAAAAGMLVVYVPGLLRFRAVMGLSWPAALVGGFFPFLVGDALKAAAAVLIAGRLRRAAAQALF